MPTNKQWLIPVSLASFLCSLLMAFLTFAIAHMQLHFCKASYNADNLPNIVAIYRVIYKYVWLLPAITATINILAVKRKINVLMLAWAASIIFLLHVVWFFAWLVFIYFANQTFIA